MQCSGFSVRSDAIPVVQTIGRVAGLLDFGDQQSGSQRVNRASRDKKTITAAWLKGVEEISRAGFADRERKSRKISAFFQPRVDLAAWCGIQDDPGFRLAQ